MKKILSVGTLIAVGLCISFLFFLNFAGKEEIKINDIQVNKSSYGLPNFEFTLTNLMDKYSSNIIIGSVVGKELLNGSREVYTVTIVENIKGELYQDILVYTIDEVFDIGESYLMFLAEHSSSLYSENFYVQYEDFVLKIGEDGTLSRLIDVFDRQYAFPFVDHEYNHIDELMKFMENRSSKWATNLTKDRAIDRLEHQELINVSDHIIEISVDDVEEVKNGLAIVQYKVVKRHKNGNLVNVHSLLLPNTIQLGEEYLLFLQNARESVTLTTREGSMIARSSPEYHTLIQLMKK